MSHPPETCLSSRELVVELRHIAMQLGTYEEQIKDAAVLIDAWVRVREAEVLKEASHHQPNYNYYGDAESCTGCDWAIGDGTINYETHIQKLAAARKQLENMK